MEEFSTFLASVKRVDCFTSSSLGLLVKRPPPGGLLVKRPPSYGLSEKRPIPDGLVSAVSNNPPIFFGWRSFVDGVSCSLSLVGADYPNKLLGLTPCEAIAALNPLLFLSWFCCISGVGWGGTITLILGGAFVSVVFGGFKNDPISGPVCEEVKAVSCSLVFEGAAVLDWVVPCFESASFSTCQFIVDLFAFKIGNDYST